MILDAKLCKFALWDCQFDCAEELILDFF